MSRVQRLFNDLNTPKHIRDGWQRSGAIGTINAIREKTIAQRLGEIVSSLDIRSANQETKIPIYHTPSDWTGLTWKDFNKIVNKDGKIEGLPIAVEVNQAQKHELWLMGLIDFQPNVPVPGGEFYVLKSPENMPRNLFI